MREPIKATPEELAELLAICHENIRTSDMTGALDIFNQYITKYGANRYPDYTAVVALGTLYRTGYILGQRRERARRTAHRAARSQAHGRGLCGTGEQRTHYLSAPLVRHCGESAPCETKWNKTQNADIPHNSAAH